ncbi:MAG: class I SAM-dependent methyltransferase [Solirubrobacteraceae bacterium]|nr:class I SAM-dependent methyltransferase [Solirubrobacteraceae bacterium]
MTTIADPGYGRQFASFYDRLFPAGPDRDEAIDRLAILHGGGPALELGAGTGRIAIPLAERTGEVVALDSSAEMLDELAAQRGTAPVEPVLGDMRAHRDDREFGLVLCVLGTLSMATEDGGAEQTLQTCAQAVAPNGSVVIETHNPAFVEALHEGRSQTTTFVPYPGRDTGLLSHSTLDLEGRHWRLSHIWFEDGRARIATESSRLLDPGELDELAGAAGLTLVARHADWRGTPPAPTHPMVVSVYRPTHRVSVPESGW